MESVKQRIAVLESAGKIVGVLGLGGEFELACLHQLVALTEQRDALVVEMKSAFEKPQAYLTWHAIPPTWEDPLPCGEYLDVHDTDGHKNSDGTDCWPVYAKPETPATDAAIAALRAEGVEMLLTEKFKAEIAGALADFDGVDDATLQTLIWSGNHQNRMATYGTLST
jgi:hypothetical protein